MYTRRAPMTMRAGARPMTISTERQHLHHNTGPVLSNTSAAHMKRWDVRLVAQNGSNTHCPRAILAQSSKLLQRLQDQLVELNASAGPLIQPRMGFRDAYSCHTHDTYHPASWISLLHDGVLLPIWSLPQGPDVGSRWATLGNAMPHKILRWLEPTN